MAVTLQGCHSRGALARGSAFQSHLLCSETSCVTLQGEAFLKADSWSPAEHHEMIRIQLLPASPLLNKILKSVRILSQQ